MVKVGDAVEIAFTSASPEEIAKQKPGTYQTEPYLGSVVAISDDFAMVNVWKGCWRLNRVPVKDLKVIDGTRLANAAATSETPHERADALEQAAANIRQSL